MIFGLLSLKDFYNNKLLIRFTPKKVLGFKKIKKFAIGDVLSVVFFSKNCPFSFEGFCFGVRKKSLISPNVSFFLSNCLASVFMFMNFSYYCNRVYNMIFLNYKRNVDLNIRKSKLYFMNR